MNKKNSLFLLAFGIVGLVCAVAWGAARQGIPEARYRVVTLDRFDNSEEPLPDNNKEIIELLHDIKQQRISTEDATLYGPLKQKLLRELTQRALDFDLDLPMFADISAQMVIFLRLNPPNPWPSAEQMKKAVTEKGKLVELINKDLTLARGMKIKKFVNKMDVPFLEQLLKKLNEFQEKCLDDSFDWLISDITIELNERPERIKRNMEALKAALHKSAAVIRVTQPLFQTSDISGVKRASHVINLRIKTLATCMKELSQALHAVIE